MTHLPETGCTGCRKVRHTDLDVRLWRRILRTGTPYAVWVDVCGACWTKMLETLDAIAKAVKETM